MQLLTFLFDGLSPSHFIFKVLEAEIQSANIGFDLNICKIDIFPGCTDVTDQPAFIHFSPAISQ